VSVSPAVTTTYTLLATGPGGQTRAQATVQVSSTLGDTCQDAFLAAASGSFSGDTRTARDDYSASNACTGYTSAGPDVVYRVALGAGDRLLASLSPVGASWDASLYLVSSCASIAQSCVAGQDNGNPEELDYTAVTAGDYFLVVDGYGSAAGPYRLDLTLNPAPLVNDTCAGAIDARAGGLFVGTTQSARDDYSPRASGSGGCTGHAAAGGDVVYRVVLAAGERLRASLDAAWDASLYLVTDCAMPAASCVAGQDDGNPEALDFVAPAAGTYFLVVDGAGGARGAFTLTVSVSPPVVGGEVCATGVAVPASGGAFQASTAGLADDYRPPLSCVPRALPGADRVYAMTLEAGDVVTLGASFEPALDGALYVVTACDDLSSCIAGADAAGSGAQESLRFVAQSSGAHYAVVDSAAGAGTHDLAIARYRGETCADAAPLSLSGALEATTTVGRANDYSPSAGACTGYTASGPDRVYAVDVAAGDQLSVSMTGVGFDASLYLVSRCADVTGSCVAGSDVGTSAVEQLAPVFAQAGRYFLILDGYAGGAGPVQLSARRRRGDTCADPYEVPAGGGVFDGTTAGYGAELGTSVASGSCTGFTQSGADAVYAVRLEPRQTLEATLTSAWDGALYLVSGCAASATTCVAGQDDGDPERITFTNGAAAATYHLVVDSWRPSSATTVREGAYRLSVTLR
jgi:hypothetical protein